MLVNLHIKLMLTLWGVEHLTNQIYNTQSVRIVCRSSMQFIDPLTAQCEFCSSISKYPVKDLLNSSATCTNCMKILIETPLIMKKSMRQHAMDMWPIIFIFDACEMMDLDLDNITDEDFDNVVYISDFKLLMEKLGCNQEIKDILKLPIFKDILSKIDIPNLESYSINTLALIANPEVIQDDEVVE